MATPAVHTAGVGAATASGLQRQTALATLSIRALTGGSLDRLMTHALETAVMLTGSAEASLWQLTPSAGRLERRQAVRGVSPGRGLACSAGSSTAFGHCVITGQPVVVDDWRRDVRFERPPHPEAAAMRSTAVVLVPGGAWTGVLAVHAEGPDAFSADTTLMLGELAGVLGVGIRRTALERLLRARSGQHAALAELGQLVLSDTPLAQVLQRAARLLADTMQADMVTVCRRDGDGGLRVHAVHPDQPPAEASLRSSVTVGIGPDGCHGTLSLHSRRPDAYSWPDEQLAEACASLLAAAVERSPITQAAEAQHRRAVSAMLASDAEERARIADALHDETVQEMAAILFTLDRVVSAARRGDGATVLDSAQQARTILAAATERVRRLLFELRPPMLDAGGLSAALHGAGASPGAVVTVRGHIGRHPHAVEAIAYRAMTDLSAEARGHPGVTRVTVELNQVDGHLEGLVSRDGPGHAAGPLPPALAAVADRVMLAGGVLEVGIDPAGVTSARVHLPVTEPAAR